MPWVKLKSCDTLPFKEVRLRIRCDWMKTAVRLAYEMDMARPGLTRRMKLLVFPVYVPKLDVCPDFTPVKSDLDLPRICF